MSEENRGDPPVIVKDKDKDKTRKINTLKSKSSGKKMESDHINSDRTGGKVTPSRQGAHSSLDAPTNQSMLDILGISPSPIKNTGTDSKGENRKGSGKDSSSQSLIKLTPPDAHAYMRVSQGKLVYSTEAIASQNTQLKDRIAELELQLQQAKESPLDQPGTSKSTLDISGKLPMLSEEQLNSICSRVTAHVLNLDKGLDRSTQLSRDVTLPITTHRPTQVQNASDLCSDPMLTAQPSSSYSQVQRMDSSKAYKHSNMFTEPLLERLNQRVQLESEYDPEEVQIEEEEEEDDEG